VVCIAIQSVEVGSILLITRVVFVRFKNDDESFISLELFWAEWICIYILNLGPIDIWHLFILTTSFEFHKYGTDSVLPNNINDSSIDWPFIRISQLFQSCVREYFTLNSGNSAIKT